MVARFCVETLITPVAEIRPCGNNLFCPKSYPRLIGPMHIPLIYVHTKCAEVSDFHHENVVEQIRVGRRTVATFVERKESTISMNCPKVRSFRASPWDPLFSKMKSAKSLRFETSTPTCAISDRQLPIVGFLVFQLLKMSMIGTNQKHDDGHKTNALRFLLTVNLHGWYKREGLLVVKSEIIKTLSDRYIKRRPM